MRAPSDTPTFSLRRTLKLGSFHIGSAFADILVTGVWNRILITDLAISATPVAFLAALRYLIAPLAIWIGHRSDTQTLFGTRRLAYIYLGRLLLWLSLPLLPLVVLELARDRSSPFGWGLALVIFLLYGLGTLISGSPFLALVRESAPPAKQGQAVVIVQTVLLSGFAVVPIVYAIAMPDYTPAAFWRLVGIALVGCAVTWLFSIWGEERAAPSAERAPTEPPIPFREMVRAMLARANARDFFWVLSAGSIALFAQDAILEPFGGDLFGLSVGETTRFNAYYGVGVLLAMIVGSALTRHWLPQRFTGVTAVGLVFAAASLGLLAAAALGRNVALVTPALFLFGIGSGIYTVGGLSLMIAMTDDRHAGAYLGLWSMAQLVFRGVGIALGGFILDTVRNLSGSPEWGYAVVFLMEIVAAAVALAFLARVARIGYLHTPRLLPQETPLAAAMD